MFFLKKNDNLHCYFKCINKLGHTTLAELSFVPFSLHDLGNY